MENMTRRAALAAALAAAAATPALAQGSLRQRIVGAYTLGDAFAVNADGSRGLWRGKAKPYNGQIMYSASGFMSVNIISERPDLPAGASLSDAQKAVNADAYLAYFGRFEVDEAKSEVWHILNGGINPGQAGTRMMRKVTLTDKQLTLTTPIEANGRYTQLNWMRT